MRISGSAHLTHAAVSRHFATFRTKSPKVIVASNEAVDVGVRSFRRAAAWLERSPCLNILALGYMGSVSTLDNNMSIILAYVRSSGRGVLYSSPNVKFRD